MSEMLTKKQRREQKKAFAQAQRESQTNQANAKKFVIAGIIVVVIIGLFWLLQSVWSDKAAPNQGTTDDPRRGGDQALVVIREYADFQCPACQTMAPYLEQALEEFGNDLAVEFNDFPLPANVHRFAMLSAEAGQCANVQGTFWEYHDKLYSEQAVWSANTSESVVQDLFVGYANNLGLNTIDFEKCLDDHEQRAIVQEDVNEGDTAKIQSTPTLFINEERYAGVSTYKSLKDVIEKQLELAKKNQAESTEVNTSEVNINAENSNVNQ